MTSDQSRGADSMVRNSDSLRALAEKATPGPWRQCGADRVGGCCCGQVWSLTADVPVVLTTAGDEEVGATPRDVVVANAAFVAAANPSAVLALLDDNERLRAALDEILGYEITSPEGGHEEVQQIHRVARAALAGGEQ